MKVHAPVEGFTGVVAGVAFADGVGEVDNPDTLLYFRRHGYRIERKPKAEAPPEVKPKRTRKPKAEAPPEVKPADEIPDPDPALEGGDA